MVLPSRKKGEETANQYDDVASAAEKKRPSLQIYKYIECTQQVMPFTYTSQHSRVRKVKKKIIKHEELIAKKSPNYRNQR